MTVPAKTKLIWAKNVNFHVLELYQRKTIIAEIDTKFLGRRQYFAAITAFFAGANIHADRTYTHDAVSFVNVA